MPAGTTWTLVIASAPWAARFGHTSVVDAAGAIYVLGGRDGNNAYLKDVWASTDQGARACACVCVRSGLLWVCVCVLVEGYAHASTRAFYSTQ